MWRRRVSLFRENLVRLRHTYKARTHIFLYYIYIERERETFLLIIFVISKYFFSFN